MTVKRVLFDTNVILDVLLERKPWFAQACSLWEAVDEAKLVAAISATTVTDIYYVARRWSGIEKAREAVRICLATFQIGVIDAETLKQAMASEGEDFEDDVQTVCAQQLALDAIITRDVDGFSRSPIAVLTPAQGLALLFPGR